MSIPSDWYYRPGTWDSEIYRIVVEFNEYRVPDRFEPTDLIVDVGTHIGSFSAMALERGAGEVIGIEADLENLALAAANVHDPRFRPIYAALDDDHHDWAYLLRSTNPVNTGGNGTAGNLHGEKVPAISLTYVLTELCERRPVRFLKMDCEGGEFPGLLDTPAAMLATVQEIAGEYHESTEPKERYPQLPIFTIDALVAHLGTAGFSSIEHHRSADNLGLFFARRA